jgi:peptide/nickel transport system substrate-binding protein
MQDGKQTIDQNKRAEIYRKAQALMYDECPVIPIAHSMVMWPAVKRVMNFKLHPTGSVYLGNVWLQ